MGAIGINTNRIDARAKVKGESLYPGDFNLLDSLVMKVLFAHKAHAIIEHIDIGKAENVPGVVMILTAKDVPNNEYGLIQPDQPVLCGPGSNKPHADHVRFVGDQVALVIAETATAAETARDLIKVSYVDLPLITSIEQALSPDTTLLHPEKGSNIFVHNKIRKGNVDTAFSKADVIVEGVYKTPVQEHAYLQPESGVAYIDESGRIAVIVGGQWIHEDQEQIAHALKIEPEDVRVIYPAIGGAFGGREDMSVQIILALAVSKLKEKGILRPVKIVWSREESIIGHHKRHYYEIKTRWGASKSGKLLAAEVDIVADGGAYMYTSTKVLANATLMCTGPYNIPDVRVDSKAVYTNNIPGGAFRGFGGPQGAFAAECQMNKLAEKLNLDPVEFRLMNLIGEGDTLSVGTLLPPGVSLDKVIKECAQKAGWVSPDGEGYKRPISSSSGSVKRGWGFSCGFKNVGFSFGAKENCWAIVELHGKDKIEKVRLRHAGAEVGQGSHTVFSQMVAHALNVPMEIVELIPSDTATSRNSGSVSASRMTFMAGNAIKGAADLALKKWNDEERPAIAEYQYFAPKTTAFDPETGECMPNFAYGYTAEAIQCEIDTETGKITLQKVICADDVGKAINPNLVEGQIEGAIVQAEGYTLLENFIQVDGSVLTDRLSTYLIPTILDIPLAVESIILEYGDHEGPWGAKGMGEMPYLPFPPAVIDAVHDASGIWFDEFPLTPERVYFGIKKNNKPCDLLC
ncbi:MAG TPA: xanthine dehydrogenase family protein molybdopterin-binding subunit [Anaerolineaceae bacterium]|nr:xanthine dehydrogenase family protein molybdopterin-binding subunit [Anaerolineaceae bacterium]